MTKAFAGLLTKGPWEGPFTPRGECHRAKPAGTTRLLMALVLLLPSVAWAQSTVGTIIGHVYDSAGTPLRGVRVSVSSETQIGGAREVTTDDQGLFRIAGLTPGRFTLTASAPKLKSTILKNIRVGAGADSEIDVLMEVETAEEQVRVVEKLPTVDTSRALVGESFDLDFVDQLPLSTRDYQGVAALTAGVGDPSGNGNPSVRGGTFFNNSYSVDGFQTTDPVTHTFGQNFSFDAITDLEVKTASYGAENSSVSGGVINQVTRSGSNRFELDISGTYNDQHMQLFRDARDIGTNRLATLSVSAGGPILKDRLWYYVSAEGISNQFTLPDTPPFPRHPKFAVLGLNAFGKINWQIVPRHKLELKLIYSPGDFQNLLQDFLVEPEAEARQFQATRFAGLTWTGNLTDDLLIITRAGLQQIFYDVGPQSCQWDDTCSDIAAEFDFADQTLKKNYTSQTRDYRSTVELSGTLEWYKTVRGFGSHALKLGSRFLAMDNQIANTVPGNAVLETVGSRPLARTEYCSNDPKSSNGACRSDWQYSEVGGNELLVFLQDAWKPTRYLTVTPGVALHSGHSNDDDQTTVMDILAFTPHFEAAWDATHNGKTVLRASFNNYVDMGFLSLARFTSRQLYNKRCEWDTQAQAFVRNCRGGGGNDSTTVGRPCGPDGLNPDGTSCATKLRAPRVWEATLGAEREILTGVSLGFDYVFRRFVHQFEDLETNAIWNQGGTALRREGSWKSGRSDFIFDLETPSSARRRYDGVTAFIRKREGLLRLRASYTWSRYEGTEDSTFASLYLDNPGQAPYYYGPLPGDHRHDVRLQASYQFLRWLSAGTIYQFLSGGPYNRLFYDPVFGSFSAFRAQRGYDPRSSASPDDDAPLRTPDVSRLDVQVRVNLKTVIKQPLDIFLDVINVLSLRTTTAVIQQDGPNWGRPVSRMQPTTARLGMRYRF